VLPGTWKGAAERGIPRACKYIHSMLVNLLLFLGSHFRRSTSGVSFVFDYLVMGDMQLWPGKDYEIVSRSITELFVSNSTAHIHSKIYNNGSLVCTNILPFSYSDTSVYYSDWQYIPSSSSEYNVSPFSRESWKLWSIQQRGMTLQVNQL